MAGAGMASWGMRVRASGFDFRRGLAMIESVPVLGWLS